MTQKNNALLKLFQQNIYDMVKSQTVAEVLPAIQKIQDAYQSVQEDAEQKAQADQKMFQASLSLIGQTVLSRDLEVLQSNYIALQSHMVPVMEYAMQSAERAAHLGQVMDRAVRDISYRHEILQKKDPEMAEMFQNISQSYVEKRSVLNDYLDQNKHKRALNSNLFRKP